MSQGMDLSIKSLIHCTGLSRSVFAKPHVREVIDNHYCAYEEAAMEECALLRGRLFTLMQRLQE